MARLPKDERLLRLATEIARREQEVERMKAEFRRLSRAPEIDTTPNRSTSLQHQVLELLLARQVALSAPEIVAELGAGYGIETVRTTLSKMAAAGAIVRVGHGQYIAIPYAAERGRRPEGGG